MDVNTPLEEVQISLFCSLSQQHMSHLVISEKRLVEFIMKNHLGMHDSCAGKSVTNLCEKAVLEEKRFCLEVFFVPFVSNIIICSVTTDTWKIKQQLKLVILHLMSTFLTKIISLKVQRNLLWLQSHRSQRPGTKRPQDFSNAYGLLLSNKVIQ